MKLRTGNSDELLASILGLEYHQLVSEYVTSVKTAFEKKVLPSYFGIYSTTREIIQSRTSEVAKKILDASNEQLIIICDGTYIRHQKSSNNIYQKKSYSGQKKTPLCKPFTICTTDGYVIDMVGPFNANLNDASIMKKIMSDKNGLSKLLKPGDIVVVDRGFRDIVNDLEGKGLNVLMPALKGNRAQLDTTEANKSRVVTKVRWVVESVHGIIKQKYRLLDHKVDNKILPNIGSLCRIACFLNNKYGRRLLSDTNNTDAIITHLKTKSDMTVNNMAQLVEENGWIRKKTIFKNISSNDLLDFPELTQDDLHIFFGGSYQLKQSICYLAELQNPDGSINIEYLKENEILRIHIKSRHINKKTYHIFIRYIPNQNNYASITDHYCTCPNGNRTAGCCSHIAAVIYYARYISRIIKPAEILTNIFDCFVDNLTVINENSDED
ncbi:uncharacterized protein LOC134793052 [Cydia splendana]|uniref:uncharacterized protein LOC134793052 n=1 Tax=Cydia splendana TaxID=1100963 RepID=UPI00300BFBA6